MGALLDLRRQFSASLSLTHMYYGNASANLPLQQDQISVSRYYLYGLS